MNKLIPVINKLGSVERHGLVFVALFIALAILQFSTGDALIGAALLFIALLPHPVKDKALADIRFGDFKDNKTAPNKSCDGGSK